MTIKEKFNVISCKDCAMPYCDSKCTMLSDRELNKLEQIADNYAIEFAEWLLRQDITLRGKNNFVCSDGIQRTTKELLEIYKKEKGL